MPSSARKRWPRKWRTWTRTIRSSTDCGPGLPVLSKKDSRTFPMPQLEEYRSIVGSDTIEELHLLAQRLKGKSVLHVNSTAVGGGVAEILNRMVPLLCELEVNTSWEVIKGGDAFYTVTKKLDRKSTRLNSSHLGISYAVFCL